MSAPLLDRFLKQLDARGLTIERGDGDTLLLKGPNAEKTKEVMAGCKAFKKQLLERFPNIKLADDPANSMTLEHPDPFHQGPMPAGQVKSVPAEFVTCPECKNDVMPMQIVLIPPEHAGCLKRCPYRRGTGSRG